MTIQARECPICDAPLPSASAGRVCDAPQCRVAYRRHLELGGPTCLVCGRPLPNTAWRGATTCGHAQCDVQFLRQKDLPADCRCRVCRVPLPPRRIAAGVCEDRECAAIDAGFRLNEANRRERERIERVRAAGAARRDREAAAAGVDDPAEFAVAVVPRIAASLRPSDEERVSRMRARLESIVRWAFSHEPSDDEPHRQPGWSSSGGTDSSVYLPDDLAPEASEVESPLFGTGCRLCRGHCCRTGGDHAYLNIAQIRAFVADWPELAEEEVVDAYISRLPEMSVEDSCVFHGELGCTLPREMRSDMCNRWLCSGLKRIRRQLQDGAPPLFFIVSADEQAASEEIVAAEFVTSASGPPSG